MKINGDLLKKQKSTRDIGNFAEDLAKRYLEAHGLVCIYQQYQVPWGEVDLIMQDKDEIVFVEVRYRQNTTYCEPHETVNRQKQKKLIKTALSFQQRFDWTAAFYLRIDVIGISGNQINNTITWIPNAIGVE